MTDIKFLRDVEQGGFNYTRLWPPILEALWGWINIDYGVVGGSPVYISRSWRNYVTYPIDLNVICKMNGEFFFPFFSLPLLQSS